MGCLTTMVGDGKCDAVCNVEECSFDADDCTRAQRKRHVHVRKGIEGDRTLSRLIHLEGDERVDEIARMLGGVDIGDATRAAARELLGSARAAR